MTPEAWELDPAADLPFKFNWSRWLADGDTITLKDIEAGTGVTVHSVSDDGEIVTFWLKDGVLGSVVTVKCEITTVAGLTDARSRAVRVVRR